MVGRMPERSATQEGDTLHNTQDWRLLSGRWIIDANISIIRICASTGGGS